MVRPFHGLVLHIEQGTEAGTDSWFHNKSSQVSAHFGNPKTGALDQWVDTDDKAWAIVAGNRYWISLENEGDSGDALTATQLENSAQLLAWLHLTENVPLQPANDANSKGLGYHGMGGAAWGNHLDCPGMPIVNQRQAIIDRATEIVGAELSSEPGHPDLSIKAAQIAAAASKLEKRSPPTRSAAAKPGPALAKRTKGKTLRKTRS
jgi:hypothetical protein